MTIYVKDPLYNVKLSKIYNLLCEFPGCESSHLWSPNMSSQVLVGVFYRQFFYLLSVVILMLWHVLFLYFGLAIWFCCVFGSPIVMHSLNVRFLVLAGVFYDIISIEITLCITICVRCHVEYLVLWNLVVFDNLWSLTCGKMLTLALTLVEFCKIYIV